MEYEKIESPLASFNNFIVTLCEQLSEIYNCDLTKTSNIIFDNDSINLFGYVKITKDVADELKICFKQPLNTKTFDIIKTTVENFSKINFIFFRYMFILNDISKNYDSTVSLNYIKSIITDLKNNNFEDKLYFIPFRHKIANDIEDNHTLENLYNKFSYGISFSESTNKSLKYSITRLISSDLDESKCIANIRPLEIDKIVTGYVLNENIENFLKQLMIYGNLTGITAKSI